MKKIFLVILLFFFSFHCAFVFSVEGDWAAIRSYFDALRDTNEMIENILTFIREYNPQVGTELYVVHDMYSFNEMKIKISAGSGGYAYLLELWTKKTGYEWKKAIEFLFNDENSGQFIWHPHELISDYREGTMDKLVYTHTDTQRSMTWEVEFAGDDPDCVKMIAEITQTGGITSVYMTVHLKTNFGGKPETNDAYLIGANISTEAPDYLATLKSGLEDIGDNYNDNFNFYDAVNPLSAALFNSSGFQTDGSSTGSYGGATYPDPANIDSSYLPTAGEVSAVTVDFVSPGDDPGF